MASCGWSPAVLVVTETRVQALVSSTAESDVQAAADRCSGCHLSGLYDTRLKTSMTRTEKDSTFRGIPEGKEAAQKGMIGDGAESVSDITPPRLGRGTPQGPMPAPNTGLRKRRDDAVQHDGAIHSWSGVRIRRGASYGPTLLDVNEPGRSYGAVAVRADGRVRTT